MAQWMTALILLLGAAGCGSGGPEPTLVFPDTHSPAEEVAAGDDSTGDVATPKDLISDSVNPPVDTVADLGGDAPAPDAGEDVGSAHECEQDQDCAHLSDNPCTFWFCHPSKKTCKPATFGDGSPCDDGDVCTVGDTCQDGVCESGEVIPPPQEWDDPCNDLVCDPETGWHQEQVDGPCDDDDPCTEGDQCHEGFCVGGPNVCTNPECGDGYCQDLETCETCPEDCGSCESSCCQGGSLPGCDDPLCQEIVCAIDGFCCAEKWDWACADFAEDHCTVCGGEATCGDGFCDFGEDCQTCPPDCDGNCDSDCCFVHPGGGCDHEICQDKICQQDPVCCEKWDAFCVEDAQNACGICF